MPAVKNRYFIDIENIPKIHRIPLLAFLINTYPLYDEINVYTWSSTLLYKLFRNLILEGRSQTILFTETQMNLLQIGRDDLLSKTPDEYNISIAEKRLMFYKVKEIPQSVDVNIICDIKDFMYDDTISKKYTIYNIVVIHGGDQIYASFAYNQQKIFTKHKFKALCVFTPNDLTTSTNYIQTQLDLLFMCKYCNRAYSCQRSLQGHDGICKLKVIDDVDIKTQEYDLLWPKLTN